MSKKTYNKPKRAQFLYFLLFFITGGILFYIKTLPDEKQNIWVMLGLLVLLIFGLMKSTRNWAHDNPKPKDEDNENDLVYKDTNIPTLEEMTKNLNNKDENR